MLEMEWNAHSYGATLKTRRMKPTRVVPPGRRPPARANKLLPNRDITVHSAYWDASELRKKAV